MTIHAPIDTRIAERQAVQAEHVARMARFAVAWANHPEGEWAKYAFLDALSFCFDSDLTDAACEEMAKMRPDLRIDADGRPLNSEGDTIYSADLRYIPLKSLAQKECVR